MKRPMNSTRLCGALAMALVLVASAGCPRPRTGEARALVLLKNQGSLLRAVVQEGDFQSLVVTVTGVSLDYAGPDGQDDPESVVAFDGTMDVDLLNLDDLASVIGDADIPAGVYTKIRLDISNPRLYLTADPETAITDVQLTANGHLFVSETFEVQDAESQIILLDFEGLHLVETGQGKYVLTPQLRANVGVEDVPTAIEGTLVAVSADDDSLVLRTADGTDITVDYTGAALLAAVGEGTVAALEADLLMDLTVRVDGVLHDDLTFTATTVTILNAG